MNGGDYRAGYRAGKDVGLSEVGAAGEIAALRELVSHWRTRAENAESTLRMNEYRGSS